MSEVYTDKDFENVELWWVHQDGSKTLIKDARMEMRRKPVEPRKPVEAWAVSYKSANGGRWRQVFDTEEEAYLWKSKNHGLGNDCHVVLLREVEDSNDF